MLFQHGINVNDLPAWQKRGVGLIWETDDMPGMNPQTDTPVISQRRRLTLIEELPAREAYGAWVRERIDATA